MFREASGVALRRGVADLQWAMPLYEYICEQDGEVIELLRSASAADDPVPDPKGQGRAFKRRHSTFATGGGPAGQGAKGVSLGGCCPCGKPGGGCASR